MATSPQFSVIIPTLNAQEHLGRCLLSLATAAPDVQLIITDGGSVDDTLAIAGDYRATIIRAPRGRGLQLKEGAKHAVGDILCFIHADSQIAPETFIQLRESFEDPRLVIGKLRLVFDSIHPLLTFYALMARLDSRWTSFGDQGIIVRRNFYEALGGFCDHPLFEDVEFLQRARQRSPIRTLTPTIVTSAQRFKSGGCLRQQLNNARLMFAYLKGASPVDLYEKYYH
jgi:rSAM/selenodomain-associated transferase 2